MLHQKPALKFALIALPVALYAFLYGRALLSRASGLDYDDRAAAEWLKVVPFVCTAAWLFVTHKLLRTFGASQAVAWTICGLTAASSAVLFLATHHTRHPLFALLVAGALLALLRTRAVFAGLLAALACMVQAAGVALVIVGIVTLVARRRLRDAAIFAAAAMLLAAPTLGWKLAHGGAGASVITHLAASEKATVLIRNAGMAFESPAALVSGSRTLYGATVFSVLLLWALIKRRQLMPDLFVLAYAAVLLFKIWPPERYLALTLPLLLWMLWRGFRGLRPEIIAAAAILLFGLEAATAYRQPPPDWAAMQRVFTYILNETPPDSIVMSALSETFAFHTGHKAVRGYRRDPFQLFYQPNAVLVTPDVLGRSLAMSGARYVVLTPGEGRPDPPSFQRAVEALERGGLLQPVAAPNLPPGYRLLSYVPIVGVVPARNY